MTNETLTAEEHTVVVHLRHDRNLNDKVSPTGADMVTHHPNPRERTECAQDTGACNHLRVWQDQYQYNSHLECRNNHRKGALMIDRYTGYSNSRILHYS